MSEARLAAVDLPSFGRSVRHDFAMTLGG